MFCLFGCASCRDSLKSFWICFCLPVLVCLCFLYVSFLLSPFFPLNIFAHLLTVFTRAYCHWPQELIRNQRQCSCKDKSLSPPCHCLCQSVCEYGSVGGGAISSVVLEGSSFKIVILSLCKLHQESCLLCCDWLMLQHPCVSLFVCTWVWVPNEPINNDCFLWVCVSSCPLRGDVKVSVNLMLPSFLSKFVYVSVGVHMCV